MSKISNQNQERIMSNIIATLYNHSPEPLFTSFISKQEARDEEFIKKLLYDLQKKEMVVLVDKSPEGLKYSRRQRWRLSNKAFDAYQKMQR